MKTISSILHMILLFSSVNYYSLGFGAQRLYLRVKSTQKGIIGDTNFLSTSRLSYFTKKYEGKYKNSLRHLYATSETIDTGDVKYYRQSQNIGNKLIHWRGEKSHGNSFQFRHAELHSSLCTVLDQDDSLNIQYKNALSASFDLNLEMTEYQTELYQNAMQYIKVLENDDHNSNTLDIENEIWIETAQRCSLIRGLYEVVAEGDTYEELALSAIANHRLDDIMINGINENATWRVRLRQYGSSASETKLRQYGKKMRSPMSQEREVVYKLKELLIKLGGDVDLKDADVSLYVFEGLIDIDGKSNRKVLARLLTKGGGGKSGLAMTSIAPVKRLCVTTTPLAPIEAFTICNVARVRSGDRILDPFAGSCTTLLAASMLVSSCKSVGIEIAHNGNVNRQNIVEDFTTRKLELPSAIIHGDAMDERVRAEARAAVGNEAFDCIITDPPYGIREKKESCEEPPLVQLVKCIAQDRNNDKRLLKKGGRLVVFVPNEKDQDVTKGMPSEADLINAGLEQVLMVEQPLNDSLSRWLVEFKCIQ